jgi:hypothetical protein
LLNNDDEHSVRSGRYIIHSCSSSGSISHPILHERVNVPRIPHSPLAQPFHKHSFLLIFSYV